jgi:hypothetical protein
MKAFTLSGERAARFDGPVPPAARWILPRDEMNAPDQCLLARAGPRRRRVGVEARIPPIRGRRGWPGFSACHLSCCRVLGSAHGHPHPFTSGGAWWTVKDLGLPKQRLRLSFPPFPSHHHVRQCKIRFNTPSGLLVALVCIVKPFRSLSTRKNIRPQTCAPPSCPWAPSPWALPVPTSTPTA